MARDLNHGLRSNQWRNYEGTCPPAEDCAPRVPPPPPFRILRKNRSPYEAAGIAHHNTQDEGPELYQ